MKHNQSNILIVKFSYTNLKKSYCLAITLPFLGAVDEILLSLLLKQILIPSIPFFLVVF